LAKVEELKGRLIPDNVEVSVSRNYGKSARDKVNSLIKKLFIATGAVTLLVWFALGIRPAIVVTLVIPVVLLMTIFSAWMLGMTIDRVSLFALIFSIGILVDDAIVVTENIYRRWLIDNKITIATAIDAVREVGKVTAPVAIKSFLINESTLSLADFP
jgi:multidrug efflux pump subunit AcrB